MIDYSLSLSIVAVLFSGVTAIFSILSYCRVVGMENSTHQIQYMAPPTPEPYNSENDPEPFGLTGEELAKRFNPDYDPEEEI